MAWLRPFFITMLACIGVFTLSRLGIVLWQFDRVVAAGTEYLPFIFAQGLRFDLLTLGVLFGIPAVLTPLFVVNQKLAALWLPVLRAYFLLVVGIVVYMEVATPSFINEFDVKPDRRFIEYLIYPQEVFGMLWTAYKLQLFMAAALVSLAVFTLGSLLRSAAPPSNPLKPWAPLVLIPVIALLVVAAIRSTTDHRPVNPSTVVYASDPLANELALNSTYTTLYALYELRHEENTFAYAQVPWAAAVAAVRAEMKLADELFVGADSTLHQQEAGCEPTQPLNLVIVLEESLGADYVGSLGGLPLTPELDALQDAGIWFDNLYATGTRSVRGIEAVVAGFPPTTARSVVKLPRSQTGFFTIARLLGAEGYSTAFLYSGEPQFDNMGRFFANNGFQTIIGRHDFAGEVFDGDWGAADEDLFNTAASYFRQQPADKPFFSLLFTTSNHSPFDYPEGRIEPYNSPAATVENAVKYADYALGEFIRKARQSPYWENTIFLIIADHSDRVYGDELVPINLFRIPAVIVGGPVQPQRIERIASQIDMLPTLLSLMGISARHPAIGIDQTREDLAGFPGRAVMQYADTQAYMEGNRVVILQKDLPAEEFVYQSERLVPASADPDFVNNAIAQANWPWQAYKSQSYILPEIPAATGPGLSLADVPVPRHTDPVL
jgi:phosphoglycerol transferase MdoB-like AlkP superfamily enzyme